MPETSLADRLKLTHPTYAKFESDWEFYADSYEGGSAFAGKEDYLFRHPRETDDDYTERLRRATYLNLVKKQVDIYAAFIFKDEIARISKDPEFLDFEKNADRKGTPLSQVMSDQVGKFGMVMGHTVSIVDLPRQSTNSKTRRDDKELGIRPYVCVYTPLEVKDWAIDGDGNYRWLRVEEDAPDESTWDGERKEASSIYRTWTRDEWYVHDAEGRELDAGKHDLKEVPAVFTPIQEHLRHMDVGQAVISDTAPLAQAIYNYHSVLDEALYRQGFNILAIPVGEKSGVPGKPDSATRVATTLGTSKGIRYPAGTNPPSYITPPSDPAEVLMKRIEDAKREFIELAKLQDRKQNSGEASGVARAYEFHESNSTFAKIAKNLEDGEKKIIRLFYKWQGKSDEDLPVTVSYPTDFNVATLADMLDEAMALLQVNVSPTANRLVKKRVVEEAFPKLDDATKNTIEEEIDAAPSEDALAMEVEKRLAEEQAGVAANADATP